MAIVTNHREDIDIVVSRICFWQHYTLHITEMASIELLNFDLTVFTYGLLVLN